MIRSGAHVAVSASGARAPASRSRPVDRALRGSFTARDRALLLIVVLSRLEDDLNDRADPARAADWTRRHAAFHAWWRHRHLRQRSGRAAIEIEQPASRQSRHACGSGVVR